MNICCPVKSSGIGTIESTLRLAGHGRIQSIEHLSQRARERPHRLYGGDAYGRLKARYDPDGRFPDPFDMVVRSV